MDATTHPEYVAAPADGGEQDVHVAPENAT